MRRQPRAPAPPVGGLFGSEADLLPAFQTMLGHKAPVTLLFDSTQDGFNQNTFHSKCNQKGPTVSIARMADGTVCGGYTERAWTSSGNHQPDPQAFLFRLKLYGSAVPLKALPTGDGQCVYDHSNYGPTFGGASDLMFFCSGRQQGSHTPNSFQYPSDPHTTSTSYPLTGGYNQMNQAGNFVVQVYQVLPGERQKNGGSSGATYTKSTLPRVLYPRVPPCGPDDLKASRDNILVGSATPTLSLATTRTEARAPLVSWQAATKAQPSPPNLLLFGPVGSGKSSLARSLIAVMEDDPDAGGLVTIGTGEGSVSKFLEPYDLEMHTPEGLATVAQLWDTAGIEVSLSQCSPNVACMLRYHRRATWSPPLHPGGQRVEALQGRRPGEAASGPVPAPDQLDGGTGRSHPGLSPQPDRGAKVPWRHRMHRRDRRLRRREEP